MVDTSTNIYILRSDKLFWIWKCHIVSKPIIWKLHDKEMFKKNIFKDSFIKKNNAVLTILHVILSSLMMRNDPLKHLFVQLCLVPAKNRQPASNKPATGTCNIPWSYKITETLELHFLLVYESVPPNLRLKNCSYLLEHLFVLSLRRCRLFYEKFQY